MYGLFLQSLGYAKDLDLSELEIGLEEKGATRSLRGRVPKAFSRRSGRTEKGKVAFALSEASRVLHSLDPRNVSDGRFLGEGGQEQGRHLSRQACRARERTLMKRRRPGQSADFRCRRGRSVRRPRRPEDARPASGGSESRREGARQALGRRDLAGEARRTGQRSSTTRRSSSPGLMDRFPLQVHLEPSDISEVTSRRVLVEERGGAG